MGANSDGRSATDGIAFKAILVFVAFHPSEAEVQRLKACLGTLPLEIGYAVVSNDHHSAEPVDALAEGAVLFLKNSQNPGYGRAVNQVVRALEEHGPLPMFVAALNTDLAWQRDTFESLLGWMLARPEVVLAVPQLVDQQGTPQLLCKRNPTLLGLFSRRFIPDWIKPSWLHRYDKWYVMADYDYTAPFEAPYLSGCCMIMRTAAFMSVGGFDERFFLYLEDADLTRSLGHCGHTFHLPIATVVHHWGRGNHHSRRLTLVNLHSAWLYFTKWGWQWW